MSANLEVVNSDTLARIHEAFPDNVRPDDARYAIDGKIVHLLEKGARCPARPAHQALKMLIETRRDLKRAASFQPV